MYNGSELRLCGTVKRGVLNVGEGEENYILVQDSKILPTISPIRGVNTSIGSMKEILIKKVNETHVKREMVTRANMKTLQMR